MGVRIARPLFATLLAGVCPRLLQAEPGPLHEPTLGELPMETGAPANALIGQSDVPGPGAGSGPLESLVYSNRDGKPSPYGQRDLGAIVHLLGYHGYGAGAFGGYRQIYGQASFGWVPVVALFETGDYELLSSGQLNLDAIWFFQQLGTVGYAPGIGGGYRWSSLLGHGWAFGFHSEFETSKASALHAELGLIFSPRGKSRVLEALGDCPVPSSCDAEMVWNHRWQLGLGFGGLFFP